MPPAAPKQVGVQEAHTAMQEEPGAVYLDVRTEEEFAEGHPAKALNIPVGHPNPETRVLELNPEFASVARAVLKPETPLLIGCRTGPRAQAAAQLLAREGYTNLRWVYGGWIGITDPYGGKVAPGWLESGLPTSHDAGPGTSYADLKKKAGL